MKPVFWTLRKQENVAKILDTIFWILAIVFLISTTKFGEPYEIDGHYIENYSYNLKYFLLVVAVFMFQLIMGAMAYRKIERCYGISQASILIDDRLPYGVCQFIVFSVNKGRCSLIDKIRAT